MNSHSCVLAGCGLSCFGQFSLLQIHSTAPDELVTIPKQNCLNCEGVSSVHRHMACIKYTGTTSSVQLEASLVWDATLLHIKTNNWSATLASNKWVDKLCYSDSRSIKKVWETSNGLLIRYVDRSVVLKPKGDATCILISADIEQYCSLTGGVAYVRLSDGRFCQCKLHPLSLTPPLLPTHFIKEVASGTDHVVLLTENGCVYTFGLGTRGQLGHGDLVTRESPCLLEALAGVRVTSIKCGNWHSMALTEYADVYSWGLNNSKQLGHSDNDAICPVPRVVTVADGDDGDGEDVSFIDIGCGSRHSAGRTKDKVLYVWGWNEYGQVFDGKISNVKYFTCGPWCTIYLK